MATRLLRLLVLFLTLGLLTAGAAAAQSCSGTITADEDDASVLVSEMEKVTRVLAVTALDVCRRKPAELALS